MICPDFSWIHVIMCMNVCLNIVFIFPDESVSLCVWINVWNAQWFALIFWTRIIECIHRYLNIVLIRPDQSVQEYMFEHGNNLPWSLRAGINVWTWWWFALISSESLFLCAWPNLPHCCPASSSQLYILVVHHAAYCSCSAMFVFVMHSCFPINYKLTNVCHWYMPLPISIKHYICMHIIIPHSCATTTNIV